MTAAAVAVSLSIAVERLVAVSGGLLIVLVLVVLRSVQEELSDILGGQSKVFILFESGVADNEA